MVQILNFLSIAVIHLALSCKLTESYSVQTLITYFRDKSINSIVYITCAKNVLRFSDTNKRRNYLRLFLRHGFYSSFVREENLMGVSLIRNYKTGIVIDYRCKDSIKHVLGYAEENHFYSTNNHFLIVAEDETKAIRKSLETIFLPPNGEVRLLLFSHFTNQSERLSLFDYYKVSKAMPLVEKAICRYCSGVEDLISNIRSYEPVMVKRKNLAGIYLKAGLVIAFPDIFTTIDDLKMKHIDTIAKGNYPISQNLKDDLNIRYDIRQLDNFGWNRNGTFDGLMGLFQRSEIECGVHAIFMRGDRISIVDYAAETFTIRACIIFKQPPLSAVSNIFVLPFTLEVWVSLLVFLVVASFAMTAQFLDPANSLNIDTLDCIHFVWGAMCQQGFHAIVTGRSARVLVFTTFVTSLFLFNSYSANIVALLQSPSESIKTIYDLVQSPLEVGSQDTLYNKIYFNETNNPNTRKLFQKKILPKGEAAFMRPSVGVEKVRGELFAYQVEAHAAYKIISDTFNEHEKCGLKELEAFKLPIIAVPVKKNFAYSELFRQRLRWQREVGLINREVLKWIPQKPVCTTKVAGFVSVGLAEFRYALQIFYTGVLISVLVLMLEIISRRTRMFVGYKIKRSSLSKKKLQNKSDNLMQLK